MPFARSHLAEMPPIHQLTPRTVAVIGGGASGLVAARELRREGHTVVVFERESQLGGTWIYDPQVESDPIGLDPNRKKVHSSLCPSLRTNLPREAMGFRDFPFVATGGPGRDSRRYPCHEEVLRYLEDFARKFKLNDLVRYDTEVRNVELENGKLKVTSTRRGGHVSEVDETFDAVIVCKGHYSQPQIAKVPGIEKWHGDQIHSHNYRVPEPYKNLVVVVIGGGSPSADDISREIAAVAKEVHVASRSASTKTFGKVPGYDNMWLHPVITSSNEDGTLTFEDGSTVFTDVILHCTGYKYVYPFLHKIDAVTVDDSCVCPLYKHVFPPGLAPLLSFVGVSSKVLPFPQSELQSKWIAGVLSGRISLPSTEMMMEDVEAFYLRLANAGVPKRHTHCLGAHMYEYLDWLATECGCAPMEEWRKQMVSSLVKFRMTQLEMFREDRDNWDEGDDALIFEAQKDFAKYLTGTEDAHAGPEPQ